jgi:hypothetical protein
VNAPGSAVGRPIAPDLDCGTIATSALDESPIVEGLDHEQRRSFRPAYAVLSIKKSNVINRQRDLRRPHLLNSAQLFYDLCLKFVETLIFGMTLVAELFQNRFMLGSRGWFHILVIHL